MEKKVAYFLVSNNHFTDQRMQRIVGSLKSSGIECHIVGRNYPVAPEEHDHVHLLNMWFKKGKLFYLELLMRQVLFLSNKKIDIICSIDADTLLAGWWISQLRGAKFYFDAHEYFSQVPEVQGRFVKTLWQWVENFVIPKVDVAYTVNHSLSKIFEQRWKMKFHIIRNLPKRIEILEVGQKENILYYQGAINEGRGIRQAIDAMEYLPHWSLVIAGGGDLLEELKIYQFSKPYHDRIQFLGVLPPSVLSTYLARAKIGLNLLEDNGFNYRYSLANKFWDYCNWQIPQINMSFPEYEFYNGQKEVSVLIPSLTVDNIVSAVKLLENKKYYKQLQTNAKELIGDNHWQKDASLLVHLYQNE